MAFDVSALAAYVKDNTDKMLAAQLVAPKTANLIAQSGNIMTGVKTSERLGIFSTDAVFQALTGCGFNASGTTTVSQRTITVGGIKVEEAICPRDLEAKYTQLMLVKGSDYEQGAFSFEKWWVDRKVAQIGVALETAIWQGDTASGTANLSKFDGLAKLIAAASDEVDANATTYGLGAVITVAGGGVTTSNVISIFDAIYLAAVATNSANAFSADFVAFTGQDQLGKLKLAIKAANLFHYVADAQDEVVMPGTGLRVIGTPGLTGTNDSYAMRLSNMYIGTDAENEEERPKVWYSQDDDNIKYSNKFKYGVNVGITGEVIKFKVD